MPETADRVVAVQLYLTPDERDQLRVIAAQAGQSMTAYCHELVLAEIREAARPLTRKTTKFRRGGSPGL
jgi:hypothetical protein